MMGIEPADVKVIVLDFGSAGVMAVYWANKKAAWLVV